MPTIDLDKFSAVTFGDAQAAQDILAEFRSSTPGDEAALRDALRRGDCVAVQRWAHRIKGAAWVIAAMELVAACEAIESAAKANPHVAGAIQLAGFDLALGRVYARVDQLLAAAGPDQ